MCFYLTKSVKVGKYLPKIVKVRKYQNNKSREIPKNTPKTHATSMVAYLVRLIFLIEICIIIITLYFICMFYNFYKI